jgi:hypothetical protein
MKLASVQMGGIDVSVGVHELRQYEIKEIRTLWAPLGRGSPPLRCEQKFSTASSEAVFFHLMPSQNMFYSNRNR